MIDLTEIARLSWDAMDEEQRKLITEVQNIKRMCMVDFKNTYRFNYIFFSYKSLTFSRSWY